MSVTYSPVSTAVSNLAVGSEFVVCDNFDPEAFPTVLHVKEWVLAKQILLAVRRDTGTEVYLVCTPEYMDHPSMKQGIKKIVMMSTRQLYTLENLRDYNVGVHKQS